MPKNVFATVSTTTTTTYNTSEKVFDRFLSQINYDTGTQCWNFRNGSAQRYGQFWDGNRNINAHRYAYEAMIAECPSDLVVSHKCDNKSCVSPFHIRPATQKENMEEASDRGLLKTARRKRRSLTPEDVQNIRLRAAKGETSYAIGKALDLSPTHVAKIVSGEIHKVARLSKGVKVSGKRGPRPVSEGAALQEAA